MDKLERYRKIVSDVLTSLARITFSNKNIVNETVYDTEQEQVYHSHNWLGRIKQANLFQLCAY